MTEQSKILKDLHELIMEILKTGTATPEQGAKIDKLEATLFKQRCFKKNSSTNHANQGEEIAALFFDKQFDAAIDKMYEYKINTEDFFGFTQYYYDDEHEDETLAEETFTPSFIEEVSKAYEVKCASK
jgi:hypothetical protein